MTQDEVSGVTTTTGRKPRYFYGWNIVAASFLAYIAYAEHASSMLAFFIKPLQNEFGWSRTAIVAVHSIGHVTGAPIALIVGPLVDRYGPRVLMPIGAIIVGLAMLGVTQITAIWQFYLLRGVIVAIGFTLMGEMVNAVAINNWFVRKRGRALAISRLGNNLNKIIFVPVTVFVIAAYDWRTMFVIFAVVTWLVVLLPSAILMRRRPEDMGLYPDGIKPSAMEAESPSEKQVSSDNGVSLPLEPVWSRREALMTGTFWLLAVCLAIDGMAFQGINISLVPYIQDLGYSEAMLATVITFRWIVAAVSLLPMGFVSEHAHRTIVRVVPFVIQGIAVCFLLSAGKPEFLWLALALYGLSHSGIVVLRDVLWANYFGRLSLGRVRSLVHLATVGFDAVGPIAVNAVFDILGSYRPAFMAVMGLYVVAAFLMVVVRPPKAHRYATVAEMTPSAGRQR